MGMLDGKVVIVTGASSGIGKATAELVAAEGGAVTVADVQEEAGAAVAESIVRGGGRAIFVRTDVSSAEDVERMVARTVDEFGALHGAFNNAGIEGESAPTHECSVENWERVLGVNLTGVWHCMRFELPRMLEAGGGSIVNCSSVAGLVGFPNVPAYVASKFGVVGLTKAAALEYATAGVRVNAICPGVIETPMIERAVGDDEQMRQMLLAAEPVGRFGRPEEVAEAAVWLMSDRSSFVTGETIVVDGGLVAR
ncbi:MAG: short chain dehydrogenase [Acidimicrobiales bacterium]|nr:MAG: short chain dehydrogenase [Acidimicrobiales bacterium]